MSTFGLAQMKKNIRLWTWLDVERVYDSRIAFRPNVIKYKMDSKEFLRSIEEPTFDFIYIDGDHTAEGVLQDAVLAWRLLKAGGIMAFDDYLWEDPRGVEFQSRLVNRYLCRSSQGRIRSFIIKLTSMAKEK